MIDIWRDGFLEGFGCLAIDWLLWGLGYLLAKVRVDIDICRIGDDTCWELILAFDWIKVPVQGTLIV